MWWLEREEERREREGREEEGKVEVERSKWRSKIEDFGSVALLFGRLASCGRLEGELEREGRESRGRETTNEWWDAFYRRMDC